MHLKILPMTYRFQTDFNTCTVKFYWFSVKMR